LPINNFVAAEAAGKLVVHFKILIFYFLMVFMQFAAAWAAGNLPTVRAAGKLI
jgi:hypothetical protein